MKIRNNISVEIIGDIMYSPVWWYTKGLKKIILFSLNSINQSFRQLGLNIWIKNLFVPMFGQRDTAGRVISFFARLIQIIFRSIGLLFWSVIYVFIILLWIIAPIYIIYQIILNIT